MTVTPRVMAVDRSVRILTNSDVRTLLTRQWPVGAGSSAWVICWDISTTPFRRRYLRRPSSTGGKGCGDRRQFVDPETFTSSKFTDLRSGQPLDGQRRGIPHVHSGSCCDQHGLERGEIGRDSASHRRWLRAVRAVRAGWKVLASNKAPPRAMARQALNMACSRSGPIPSRECRVPR
jgi:hypothetical protein